jgi:glycerol-3-phosphate dehydrogenase (NAD(P)+)
MSSLSRNYKFGRLIADGLDAEAAKAKIGMVVEGIYSCVSALQLGKKHHIPLPITQAIYSILYEQLNPKDAVKNLLQRAIKEEHL